MTEGDRRRTERLLLTIPIRVMAFGGYGGRFSEDTHTVEINRSGARIALRQRVTPNDTLRIVNLENFREADFRVVGATRLAAEQGGEWGVECLEEGHNIWGIDFPPLLASHDSQAGALLECRGCGQRRLHVLNFVELDILDASGVILQACAKCGQFSSWSYADRPLGPGNAPTPQQLTSPPLPRPEEWDGKAERRAHKRLPLKMPILVRSHNGQQQISKTENVSKGGFAACLSLDLPVGGTVTVVCPYTEGGPKLEQKAEVRLRKVFTAGERWLYGFKYVT